MIEYVNNNGEVLSGESFSIRAGNRGFLYGDGVFESVRILNGRTINLENHIARMMEGAAKLKMRVPSYYTLAFFEDKINELIQKSAVHHGGKCRISLDRARGGTYSPESNEVEYFIEVSAIENNFYVLNPKGKEVDVFSEYKKQMNALANYKTKNGLLYVLASVAAKEKNIDEFLLLNTSDGIIESTSSNLFVVSNGVLYTPGLEEGCLAGTMRMQVINIALQNGLKVYECTILPQNLLVADEIFLTNAISGITWVSGYRTKRYFNNVARRLVDLLNEKWTITT